MAGFVLGLPGIAAAGIGCALADLVSGYAIYIPVTAVLKALIALAGAISARCLFRGQYKLLIRRLAVPISSFLGEMIMVLGYFAYEYFIIGVGEAAVVSLPANLGQAALGIVASVIIAGVFAKNHALSGFVSANVVGKNHDGSKGEK